MFAFPFTRPPLSASTTRPSTLAPAAATTQSLHADRLFENRGERIAGLHRFRREITGCSDREHRAGANLATLGLGGGGGAAAPARGGRGAAATGSRGRRRRCAGLETGALPEPSGCRSWGCRRLGRIGRSRRSGRRVRCRWLRLRRGAAAAIAAIAPITDSYESCVRVFISSPPAPRSCEAILSVRALSMINAARRLRASVASCELSYLSRSSP